MTSSLTVQVIAINGSGAAELLPGTKVGPRILRDWELVMITAGSAMWERGLERIELKSGDLLLAPPGQRERLLVAESEALRHLFIHVVLNEAAPRLPRLVRRADSGIAAPLIRHVLHLASTQPPGWHAQACDVLGVLLRAVSGGCLDAPEEPLRPLSQVVVAALAHLRTRWRSGLVAVGCLELARAAGVSREHLTRCFRSDFAMGPSQAERLLRLDRAIDWLVSTDLPVPEIARRAGWRDAERFAAALRAAFGHSPRALRRAWRDGLGVRQVTLARLGSLRAAAR
jgi:AraC family transcriptional regulator